MRELLSYADACAVTGLSLSTIKRVIARHEIPALKIGRSVRIRRADLDAWLSALPTKGGDDHVAR